MKRTNPTRILSVRLLALAAGLSSPALADIHAIVGNPTQGGELRTFAEGTGLPQPAPSELRGIELLPIDFNGRLAGDQLLAQAAHHRSDIEGAGRIELPLGKGVLYRFRRSIPGLDARFGFLHMDAAGHPRLLAERWGAGPQRDRDPYHSRIGLAADGDTCLVMTTTLAGGNLMEVSIPTGVTRDRSSALAPLDFRPQSARHNGDWCIVVARQGTFRCGLGAGDQLANVAFDGNTIFYSGELVTSADTSQALTTAGSNATSLHAWVIGKTGNARRASRLPGPMSGAGFLPEASHGPFLSVDNEGVLCAWRMEGVASREVFVRRSTSADSLDATQITGDANFTDTLDEPGVLNGALMGQLVMAVGEVGTDPGVGLEKADFFRVTLDAAGVATIQNISGTSGQFAAPYLAIPTLSPLFMRWLPTTQSYVLWDEQSGGTGRLLELDLASTGVRVLKNDIKEVFFLEQAGSQLLVSVRLSSGNKPHQLLSFPSDLSTPASIVLDTGDDPLLQPVVDPAGWIAFREVPEIGLERLWIYGGSPQLLASFPLRTDAFGPVIAWTPTGDLSFSFDQNGLRFFAAWPRTSAPYRLRAIDTQGVVLPGR